MNLLIKENNVTFLQYTFLSIYCWWILHLHQMQQWQTSLAVLGILIGFTNVRFWKSTISNTRCIYLTTANDYCTIRLNPISACYILLIYWILQFIPCFCVPYKTNINNKCFLRPRKRNLKCMIKVTGSPKQIEEWIWTLIFEPPCIHYWFTGSCGSYHVFLFLTKRMSIIHVWYGVYCMTM